MEILYVILNNGELQYVEYDKNETSQEEMIEMLKESNEVKKIYSGLTNVGPMGLLWQKDEEIEIEDNEEKLTDDEYERLVKRAVHNEVLDFYDISNAAGELFEDVYNYLGFKQDESWIVAPEVLRDNTLMNKLYETLRKAVLSELKHNEYVFDTEHDKYYNEHKGTEQVLKLFNIQKKTTFDTKFKDADTSTLDALIKDEEEAIEAYTKAINESQSEEAAQIYEHIKREEDEHLKELKALKERMSRG